MGDEGEITKHGPLFHVAILGAVIPSTWRILDEHLPKTLRRKNCHIRRHDSLKAKDEKHKLHVRDNLYVMFDACKALDGFPLGFCGGFCQFIEISGKPQLQSPCMCLVDRHKLKW